MIGFVIIVFVMFNMSVNAKRVGLTWIAAGVVIALVHGRVVLARMFGVQSGQLDITSDSGERSAGARL